MNYVEVGLFLLSVICGVVVFHAVDFSCRAKCPLIRACEVSLTQHLVSRTEGPMWGDLPRPHLHDPLSDKSAGKELQAD